MKVTHNFASIFIYISKTAKFHLSDVKLGNVSLSWYQTNLETVKWKHKWKKSTKSLVDKHKSKNKTFDNCTAIKENLILLLNCYKAFTDYVN